MASTQFSYYRLNHEIGLFDEESKEDRAFRNIRGWSKIGRFLGRRRPKVQILGLRRFKRKRKRKRFFTRLRVSWGKTLKRLKNGQAHMSDLFGGSCLFMQLNYTTPFRCGDRPYMGHGLHGMPSRHGRIA